jgi:TPR repeat protein
LAFLDPAPCSCLRGASAARPAALSLDTAAIVTGKSKSTLWRRVAAGDIARLVCHERRAMVALDDIAPLIPLALGDDDLALLVAADAGDVVAQCDMGHLFLAAAAPGVALHWLRLAAAQKCADAMQVLGCCHLHGWGVPRDENLGIVWIASAAALGHVIARPHLPARCRRRRRRRG